MKRSMIWAMAAVCGVLVTGCGAQQAAGANGPAAQSGAHAQGKTGPTARWSAPPAMAIDKSKAYLAIVKTNYGVFTLRLFARSAPVTVNNFVFLARHDFYNGDTFFRIIKPFMIQTGDPLNNGTGGPGYTFADELPPKRPYRTGIVAMANRGPNTNGSQFFICTGAQSSGLNSQPNYTQFAQVVSGMKAVESIASIPVVANPAMNGEVSKPTKTARIERITVEVK